MQNRLIQNSFFIRALKAANISPEMFAAEFKKEDADANVKEYEGELDKDSLIHRIVDEIPDDELPAILSILMQHKVDLNAKCASGWTALSIAAFFLKHKTVNFLIEHKAEINDPQNPALCSVMKFDNYGESLRLDIVKTLLQHKAKINIQDESGRSPLHYATQSGQLSVMNYLISHGADLFLKSRVALGKRTGTETVLGIAYANYINATKRVTFKENDPQIINRINLITSRNLINRSDCLNVLIRETQNYLFHEGSSFTGSNIELETFLNKRIEDLAGDFRSDYSPHEINSVQLKKYLEQMILSPVLTQIKKEREERDSPRASSFSMWNKRKLADSKDEKETEIASKKAKEDKHEPRVKIEKSEKNIEHHPLAIEEIRAVAKFIRGRSQARFNCVHLAYDMLKYFMTGQKPEKHSITRPVTRADSDYLPTLGFFTIKKEGAVPVAEIKQSVAILQDSGPAALIPPDEYPREVNGKVYMGTSVIDLAHHQKIAVDHKNIDKYLMEQAGNGVIFGTIDFGRVGEFAETRAGHQIVFYATRHRVVYVDPQIYDGKKDKGDPVFTSLSEKGPYEFLSNVATPNADTFGNLCFVIVYDAVPNLEVDATLSSMRYPF